MIRTYREAMKYGNMWHLTLTYDDFHLPMSQVVFSVDRDSGLMSPVVPPASVEKVATITKVTEVRRFHKRSGKPLASVFPTLTEMLPAFSAGRASILADLDSPKRRAPRVFSEDLPSFGYDRSDLAYHYVESPSYDPKDVQDLFKYCKLWYSRDFGEVIDNLRYIVSPEYGERSTRRPHYHCILINCPEHFARFLADVWCHGYWKHFKNGNSRKYFGYGEKITLQKVWLHNSRYSGNGFKNVASYLSKYTCKGFMDNPAALSGYTQTMRVMTSKNFGSQLSEDERRHFLALDVFDYNPDNISRLPKKKLSEIVDLIISRLTYKFPVDVDKEQFPYKLPSCIRRRIFGFRLCKSRQDLPKYLAARIPPGEAFPPSGKTVYNSIYYAVSDVVRDRLLQKMQRQFEDFVAQSSSKDLPSAVAAFQVYLQSSLKEREETHKQNLLKYLKHATI